MTNELNMTNVLQLAIDAKRCQEFRERWPDELQAIINVLSSLADEFTMAGGEATVGRMRSVDDENDLVAAFIIFDALPCGTTLLAPASLSLRGDYSTGRVRVQRSTRAVSWLTLDELHAVSEEQLALEELLWAIKKQFRQRNGDGTTPLPHVTA